MTESPTGLVVIDKPSGWTSHDGVGRVRRLAGTRKVGHAGTLDPMATGVLICGIGRATRLLGHLSAHDKAYDATIRLGQQTITDDADGEVCGGSSAAEVSDELVARTAQTFVGTIAQVPSSVSAVKVDGKRSYARVRAGEDVVLAARTVTISELTVHHITRPTPELIDVGVSVTCSSGTYVRAIARDLGERLGVGGHLTALRRTRVGGFDLTSALTLEQLESSLSVIELADAVRSAFPVRIARSPHDVDLRHGRPIPTEGETGVTGVFDESGQVLALAEPREGLLRVVAGFTG
jgi:tRNA pseudouridine55 synthase